MSLFLIVPCLVDHMVSREFPIILLATAIVFPNCEVSSRERRELGNRSV